MAIGTFLAIAAAASTVASTFVTLKQGKKASRARKTANAIAGANEETRNRLNRRQAAKQTRLKQAQVLQASENSGVTGSSGQIGAVGSLQRTFAQATAFQSTNILAAKGISTQNQIAANASDKADQFKGIANIFSTVNTFANSDAGQDLFGSA